MAYLKSFLGLAATYLDRRQDVPKLVLMVVTGLLGLNTMAKAYCDNNLEQNTLPLDHPVIVGFPCSSTGVFRAAYLLRHGFRAYPIYFLVSARDRWISYTHALLIARLVLSAVAPAEFYREFLSRPLNGFQRLLVYLVHLVSSFQAAPQEPSHMALWYLRTAPFIDVLSTGLFQMGFWGEAIYGAIASAACVILSVRYGRSHPALGLKLPLLLIPQLASTAVLLLIERRRRLRSGCGSGSAAGLTHKGQAAGKGKERDVFLGFKKGQIERVVEGIDTAALKAGIVGTGAGSTSGPEAACAAPPQPAVGVRGPALAAVAAAVEGLRAWVMSRGSAAAWAATPRPARAHSDGATGCGPGSRAVQLHPGSGTSPEQGVTAHAARQNGAKRGKAELGSAAGGGAEAGDRNTDGGASAAAAAAAAGTGLAPAPVAAASPNTAAVDDGAPVQPRAWLVPPFEATVAAATVRGDERPSSPAATALAVAGPATADLHLDLPCLSCALRANSSLSMSYQTGHPLGYPASAPLSACLIDLPTTAAAAAASAWASALSDQLAPVTPPASSWTAAARAAVLQCTDRLNNSLASSHLFPTGDAPQFSNCGIVAMMGAAVDGGAGGATAGGDAGGADSGDAGGADSGDGTAARPLTYQAFNPHADRFDGSGSGRASTSKMETRARASSMALRTSSLSYPYRGYVRRTRLISTRVKIQGAEPSDVVEGYQQRIAHVLAESNQELEAVYIRGGCIELVVDSSGWTTSDDGAPTRAPSDGTPRPAHSRPGTPHPRHSNHSFHSHHRHSHSLSLHRLSALYHHYSGAPASGGHPATAIETGNRNNAGLTAGSKASSSTSSSSSYTAMNAAALNPTGAATSATTAAAVVAPSPPATAPAAAITGVAAMQGASAVHPRWCRCDGGAPVASGSGVGSSAVDIGELIRALGLPDSSSVDYTCLVTEMAPLEEGPGASPAMEPGSGCSLGAAWGAEGSMTEPGWSRAADSRFGPAAAAAPAAAGGVMAGEARVTYDTLPLVSSGATELSATDVSAAPGGSYPPGTLPPTPSGYPPGPRGSSTAAYGGTVDLDLDVDLDPDLRPDPSDLTADAELEAEPEMSGSGSGGRGGVSADSGAGAVPQLLSVAPRVLLTRRTGAISSGDPAAAAAAVAPPAELLLLVSCPSEGRVPELVVRSHGAFLPVTLTSCMVVSPPEAAGAAATAAAVATTAATCTTTLMCTVTISPECLPAGPGLLLAEVRWPGQLHGSAAPLLLVDDPEVVSELMVAVESWTGAVSELQDVLLDLACFLAHAERLTAAAAAAAVPVPQSPLLERVVDLGQHLVAWMDAVPGGSFWLCTVARVRRDLAALDGSQMYGTAGVGMQIQDVVQVRMEGQVPVQNGSVWVQERELREAAETAAAAAVAATAANGARGGGGGGGVAARDADDGRDDVRQADTRDRGVRQLAAALAGIGMGPSLGASAAASAAVPGGSRPPGGVSILDPSPGGFSGQLSGPVSLLRQQQDSWQLTRASQPPEEEEQYQQRQQQQQPAGVPSMDALGSPAEELRAGRTGRQLHIDSVSALLPGGPSATARAAEPPVTGDEGSTSVQEVAPAVVAQRERHGASPREGEGASAEQGGPGRAPVHPCPVGHPAAASTHSSRRALISGVIDRIGTQYRRLRDPQYVAFVSKYGASVRHAIDFVMISGITISCCRSWIDCMQAGNSATASPPPPSSASSRTPALLTSRPAWLFTLQMVPLLVTCLPSFVTALSRPLLARPAWERLVASLQVPHLLLLCVSGVLIGWLGFPPAEAVRGNQLSAAVFVGDGIVEFASTLTWPDTAAGIALLRIPVHLALWKALGADFTRRWAVLRAVAVAALSVSTSITCHVYLSAAYRRRARGSLRQQLLRTKTD